VRCKGKVIAHREAVTIRQCEFHVGEKARLRVCANRCREVHAWISGELVEDFSASSQGRAISYNPYKSGSFYYRDNGEEIASACAVRFNQDGSVIAYQEQ
jgi:hypothetical protein